MPPSSTVLLQAAFNVALLHFKKLSESLLPPSPVALQNLYQRMPIAKRRYMTATDSHTHPHPLIALNGNCHLRVQDVHLLSLPQ